MTAKTHETDYDTQAANFLVKTKTALTWKFLRYGIYFHGDKEKRLVWQFTLQRGGRHYTGTFGDSISETFAQLVGEPLPYRMTLHHEEQLKRIAATLHPDGTFRRGIQRTLRPPSHYSLLACLEKYEPEADIDSWAREMGYDLSTSKISHITETHRACREQYAALCALYSEDEMEELRAIS